MANGWHRQNLALWILIHRLVTMGGNQGHYRKRTHDYNFDKDEHDIGRKIAEDHVDTKTLVMMLMKL